MFILYDIIFIIFAILYFPYVILKKKWHAAFRMRFGFFSADLKRKLEAKENIWIHAVSVGEVMAVKNFVQRLRELHPGKQIVVSTVTTTGNQLAREQFPEAIVIYAPLDFSICVLSYLKAIRPVIYIAAETEIWPNIFYWLNRYNIPIVLINGRISDLSYKRYMKFRFIIKHVLSYVNFFGMQAPIDAERIADIGADQSNVAVTGNMKFDQVSTVGAESFGQFFRGDNVKIIVAGSTHPGEEEMIIRVFNALKEKHYNARLIIAPRHVERVSEVEAILKKEQCLFSKFSENIDASQRHYGEDILLVDTIGHLRSLYALADIVFVGKSLTGHGGQNILEPAFFAKPIIVGPHMENFRAIKDLFLKAEALIIVRNEQELQQSIIDLLENQPKATKLGKNGYDVVKAQQGSVEKTFKEVQRFL